MHIVHTQSDFRRVNSHCLLPVKAPMWRAISLMLIKTTAKRTPIVRLLGILVDGAFGPCFVCEVKFAVSAKQLFRGENVRSRFANHLARISISRKRHLGKAACC